MSEHVQYPPLSSAQAAMLQSFASIGAMYIDYLGRAPGSQAEQNLKSNLTKASELFLEDYEVGWDWLQWNKLNNLLWRMNGAAFREGLHGSGSSSKPLRRKLP